MAYHKTEEIEIPVLKKNCTDIAYVYYLLYVSIGILYRVQLALHILTCAKLY